jgi:glycosyltransferase involved in cell wall biosynthesis
MDRHPKVSIGMPVYNGEDYIEAAIESILAQTFDDFELIISDNASTDRTEEICAEFAAKDPRIHYVRQKRNLGAAPNHNFTVGKARGEYFKWSAHDDVMEPQLLERCVEVLERYPEVQLVFPRTLRIDETGATVGRYPDYASMRLMSSRPSQRFGDIICKQHNCVNVFGLARRDVFAETGLLSAREDSDRHLLAHLALRGPLFEVPQYLFKRRDHAQAYSQSVPRDQRMAWWDTSRTETITFPEWRSLAVYLRMIKHSDIAESERRACRLQLVRWVLGPKWYRQRWVKLLRDAVLGGYRHLRRMTNGSKQPQ